ncbi:MAG: HNH endonuclease [Chloroflexi bacterium]|nr:HNH endonuclease [Chloroflexota bacterium]
MTRRYIPKEIRERVRKTAGNRCGYCQSHQKYILGPLEIERIIPRTHGGTDGEENLWLACRLCNSYKGSQYEFIDPVTGEKTPLYNPRRQKWRDHFTWDEEGVLIRGVSPTGRATVIALQLNNVIAVNVRRGWIKAGWHPPQFDEE